jgi:hypothetical protein
MSGSRFIYSTNHAFILLFRSIISHDISGGLSVCKRGLGEMKGDGAGGSFSERRRCREP